MIMAKLSCDECECNVGTCLKYSKFLDKETMFVLEIETNDNFKFKCTPLSISKNAIIYMVKDGTDYYGAIRTFNRIKSAVCFNLNDNYSSDNGECWKPTLIRNQRED